MGSGTSGSRVGIIVGRVGVSAGVAALSALAMSRLRERVPGGAERWQRQNHRGETITLIEGPLSAAAAAGALLITPAVPPRMRAAGLIAVLGAGGMGLLDDLAESGSAKGLRGHVGALRRGQVTTGMLKIAGIGASGVAAAAVAHRSGPRGIAQTLLDGALVAGSANLINLFDLRPGRALKVVLVQTPVMLTAGPAGGLAAAAVAPAVGLLPSDLAERSMLGDCGANALGALSGVVLLAMPVGVRRTALVGVVGLILASERVSFTRVIESTPVLREVDALGRRKR